MEQKKLIFGTIRPAQRYSRPLVGLFRAHRDGFFEAHPFGVDQFDFFFHGRHPICKDFLSARVKLRIKEKSGATNTGQFSEKSEGAKLSNSLMVLGYENGLILSICFYLGSFPTRSCFRKGESDDESFDIHH